MIKSHLQAALIQRVFRHVHGSSSIEITVEFSFVGIALARQLSPRCDLYRRRKQTAQP
jgi:hypothetical protein